MRKSTISERRDNNAGPTRLNNSSAFDRRHQVGWLHLQSPREFLDGFERGGSFSALDERDSRSVQTGIEGEVLLRQSSLQADLPYAFPKVSHKLAAFHWTQRRVMLTMRLHTTRHIFQEFDMTTLTPHALHLPSVQADDPTGCDVLNGLLTLADSAFAAMRYLIVDPLGL